MKKPQLRTHGSVTALGGNEIEVSYYTKDAHVLYDQACEFGTLRSPKGSHTFILTVFGGYDVQEVYTYLTGLLAELDATLT